MALFRAKILFRLVLKLQLCASEATATSWCQLSSNLAQPGLLLLGVTCDAANVIHGLFGYTIADSLLSTTLLHVLVLIMTDRRFYTVSQFFSFLFDLLFLGMG